MSKPGAFFVRVEETERRTGAWLAGYLLMLRWHRTEKTNQELVRRVTNRLVQADMPHGALHVVHADREFYPAQATGIEDSLALELIVRETGAFETRLLPGKARDAVLRHIQARLPADRASKRSHPRPPGHQPPPAH